MERISKEVNVHFTALLDKKTTLQIENTKIPALTFHPASLTAQPKKAFHQKSEISSLKCCTLPNTIISTANITMININFHIRTEYLKN